MPVVRPLALTLLIAANASTAQPVAVVDDASQRIELAHPAQRIVSLAPHITEQLFAIGAGDRIVATTDFADYPPAAAGLPRVARAHSVDVERVAAAKPDLIVIWGSGFPPGIVASLRRLNVPVFISEPGSLDSIATSLERLGQLTASAKAPRAAADFRAAVDALQTRYAGRAPVRVFYQVWAQPLMTLAGTHVINEAIRLCGGRNVFEHLASIAPQVAIEAVITADPQLIVTAEPGARPSDALSQWQRFRTISAVRNQQLVTLDADRINRHGPRIVDEIAVLCKRVETARALH
jgi:iron complex transport system substrate-binding protein